MKKILPLFLAVVIVFTLAFIPKGDNLDAQTEKIVGSGASFPQPLYLEMFANYDKAQVDYLGGGSGKGISDMLAKKTDFGGTDGYMVEEDFEGHNATNDDILHVPSCIGAIAVSYNLTGVKLRMDGPLVADIFLGKVTKWNDERIKELNPKKFLPNLDITVVHRSDRSGTSKNFTGYLSQISEEWEEKVGTAKSVDWPTGQGAQQNPGVAGLIKQIRGSIGYLSLDYALANNIPVADLKNSSGNFITPSLESASFAGDIEDMPDDTKIYITNSSASNGYPISTFTWLIFYKEQNYGGRSKERAKATMELLWWMLHDGQKYAEKVNFAPIPKIALEKSEALLRSVTYDGEPLLNK
ncbi:MAG: phosphate ABC transporter substrate-binding protein PstS [Spirochaetota bacterium]